MKTSTLYAFKNKIPVYQIQSNYQHIMPTPTVSQTTEQDVEGLPAEKQFKFVCDKCRRPTQHNTDYQFTKADIVRSEKQQKSQAGKEH